MTLKFQPALPAGRRFHASPFAEEGHVFSPLRAAIVGGGSSCHDLLKNVHLGRLDSLNITIVGVAEGNQSAPGLLYAKAIGIFTTSKYHELYRLEGINLIIELTGSDEIVDDILRSKPRDVFFLDHKTARALWVPLLKEASESQLETLLLYHKKTRQRTQLILDSLPYRLMVVNKDMTINMVNQTFLKHRNLRSEDVIGRHCHMVRYGLERPCSECGRRCYFEEVKRSGTTISTIHEFIGEDGRERFDVITVSPIFDEHGEVVQILEVSRDVTERIRLEKEVERYSIFLKNVIQSTVDGIVVVDTKGKVLLFNEGMERLTSYSASEIMEMGHISSFYDMDVARENMKKMRSSHYGPPGKLNPTSMTIRTKGGELIPVTLSASLILMDGKEVGSVGVFTDMREVIAMRKDLEEAQVQLMQSEKIASVGRMAAGVAHEINNPLSGIMLYAELLKENLRDQPAYVADLQEIIDQTIRCKRIISELLEFSRKSVGKISSFRIEEAINKSLNLLINQAIFQNIEVIKVFDPGMPEMAGDLIQIQQVFTNLFINASDAMERKGTLRIGASFDEVSSRFTITIADTGPGIPKELRDRIFEIFFTTKPPGKGTGLGLSISQNIIKLHGGTIKVDCPPEGGTVFTIELPLGFVSEPEEKPLFA
ncbi:MAG: PAS domain S-box protein [Desulfobacteraceae bacterium]|jgi:PAS domain S-box-containing protein|nr:MAG: PAS domain S-box protein [Desulfobacteraceae bacterium]